MANQELAERHTGRLGPKIRDEGRPPRSPNRGLEVVEDDLATLAVKIHRAAGWQEGELSFDLFDDRASSCVEDGSESVLKSELAMLLPDQVDHREAALVAGPSQPAAELLREHGRRRGRPEQEHGVDIGNVHTLAEDLDREHAAESASLQLTQALSADVRRIVACERDALQPCLGELQRHVPSVLLRDTEPERPHPTGVEDDSLEGLQELGDAE